MKKRRFFRPQEDITPYELARIVRLLAVELQYSRGGKIGQKIRDDEWGSLPDNAKRHFEFK